MSDFEFESRLERLFSQPPAVSDPAAFAAGVQARLERGWGVRSLAIGAAGIVGAVIAASQIFGSNLMQQVEAVRMPVEPLLSGARPSRLMSAENMQTLAGSGEVMWIAAAMLALTVGIAATRLSDAF